MWIDAHAHLSDFNDAELPAILDEAAVEGVELIVSTATDVSDSRIVAQQCASFSSLVGAVGISPCNAADPPESWYEEIARLLSRPRIIAVGEIGIDAANPHYPPLSVQRPMFERQLALARSMELPVIIHSRGAEKLAADICKSTGVARALFHCFTGSAESLASVLEAGYYVSISGIVTFKGNALCDIVGSIPPERLLIETDSPYLAPAPHRGKKNRPAWVRFVGEEVARIKGIGIAALQKQIEENFKRLFGNKS